MKNARRLNLIIALVALVVIIVFAFVYNASVIRLVTNAIKDDREVLKNYNADIIVNLTEAQSIDQWQAIIDEYDEIIISIWDDEATRIVYTTDRSRTALDIRVRTPFNYGEHAYMLTSSIYLLPNNHSFARDLTWFILVEFVIGLTALGILAFVIYTLMLRPYRRFYYMLGAYERGETPKEQKLRGNIGKIYARFVEMTRTIDSQQQNERRIIASISHDIKTPLTSILGYTERLRKSELSREKREQYLSTIYSKANEMQTLIDEFDEYLSYRMLKQSFAERMTTEALSELLESEFKEELQYAGIRFSIRNDAPGAAAMVDRTKVRRVAGNIISNSTKHVPPSNGIIEIVIDSDRDDLIIKAADNGDGVKEEDLPYIFDTLFTTDTSRSVAGLGLSICKEIVESRGGTISAAPSQSLGGLEITITIPRT